MANTIEQYGITWTFDKNLSADGAGDTYRYGQFVNGDYWVVGPVTITSINPLCQTVDERVVNGTMINPHAGSFNQDTVYGAGYGQGYDSAASQWNAALNVGDDLPLAVAAGSSVVSTISRPSEISKTAVKTAAILTVLSQAPAEGSFRPPYSGTDKTIYFNKSDLDYTKLSNLTEQTGAPSLSTAAAWFEKPWIDHVGNWYGDQIHPSDNMSNYGREMAHKTSQAALLLNCAYSNAEKETLLVRYVQLGIDNYAVVSQGIKRIYVANGGHGGGRKLPILVAGLVLDDVTLKGVGSKSGAYLYNSVDEDGYPDPYGPGNEPADYMSFGEDDQTHYVTQFDVDLTNGPTWEPDERNDVLIPYTVDDIGLPEWGIRHSYYPTYNNNWWPTNYRSVAGCTFPGTALAAHIMGLKTFWNNDAFFDYCDRYMAMIVVGGAYESWRTGANGPGDFVNNMWDAYREDYGPLWTADLSVTAAATGIRDTEIDLKATISGGVGDYTVQWQQWDGEAFVDINGATTAIYTVTGLSAGTEYTFKVVVEDEESPATQVTDTVVVSTTGEESPAQYLLQVGSGITVSGAEPVEGNYYEADAVLTLTAVEGRYTLFTGWSGDASGKRKHIQITMNSAKNITTNFVAAEVKSVNIQNLSLITKTPIEV